MPTENDPPATLAPGNDRKESRLWETLVFLVAAIGLFATWQLSRDRDAVLGLLGIAAGLVVLFAVLALASKLRERSRKSTPLLVWSDLRNGPAVLFGIAVAIFVFSGWLFGIVAICSFTVHWISDPSTSKDAAQWLVVPFVAIAGVVLFFMRLKLRFLYGGIEIAIALVAAWTSVQAVVPGSSVVEDQKFLMTLLTASLYLFVRGADNVHTALKAATPDPSLLTWREALEELRGLF